MHRRARLAPAIIWAMRSRSWIALLAAVTACGAGPGPCAAQELEPRAYSASPIRTTFLVAGIGRLSGGVFTDPSVPFEDVEARLGVATVAIGHVFDLFTRTALVTVAVPYVRGRASGRIEEDVSEATRTGWADARLKLSVNLLGGRARRAPDFAAAARSTILGVSLAVVPPMGQYHPNLLVNIGSNRWAFKPEAGVSVPLGARWTVDAYSGVWLFGTNDSFYPGTARREQDPVVALQGHVSYTIRPRFWVALTTTWYGGGRTTVDGVDKLDLQRNSRIGGTVSVPIGASQSVKVAYSTGATTRIGGDFNTVAVAWQIVWVSR